MQLQRESAQTSTTLAADLAAKNQEMEAALEAKKHDMEQMRIALGAKEERLDEAEHAIAQLEAELQALQEERVTVRCTRYTRNKFSTGSALRIISCMLLRAFSRCARLRLFTCPLFGDTSSIQRPCGLA